MEIIRLSGYTEHEKLGIARNYLVPRQLKEHGITGSRSASGQDGPPDHRGVHPRGGRPEPGAEIGHLCRKVARKIAEGDAGPFAITTANLQKYLGAAKFLPETERTKDEVGSSRASPGPRRAAMCCTSRPRP